MPSGHDPDREHDRGELEGGKERLVGAQVAEDALGGLGEAEDGAEEDEDAGGGEGGDERGFLGGMEGGVAMEGMDERCEQGEEDGEGKGLEGEAAEEDDIGGFGALAVGLGVPDQGRAGYLGDGSDDVADDEPPEDQLRAKDSDGLAIEAFQHGPCDEFAKADIDAG